jgi:hypothetical protein
MSKKNILLFAVSLLLFSNSCRHDTDLTLLKEVSYSLEIQPIIAGNCTQSGCHNSQGGEVFSLVTYIDVMDGGVKAGDAHGSKFYNVISNHTLENIMPPPPLPSLSNDQIKLIYIWIEQCAKNN